jgi:hypothetical protein
MPRLSQSWSVPFSPGAALCFAMDSSTGPAPVTSSNNPRNLGFTLTGAERTVEALGEPTGVVVIID